jgi:hypothetical protein
MRIRLAAQEMEGIMEAERLNAVANALEDLDRRAAELRRYL